MGLNQIREGEPGKLGEGKKREEKQGSGGRWKQG